MTLENLGIPTVVICTGPFMDSAFVHSRSFGNAGFQPVSIPHPLGGLVLDDVNQRAASIHDQIVAALTGGS
ncbi:MAG: hypothetical protein IIB30_01310 [Chloroflexi bacterium]|nr:hypothetical protein [Chloroflexota bacterium]